MESLAQNIGGPATPRPALSQGASTQAVLQEGRVVAGEVVKVHANGNILVAVGNIRVPARAQIAMEPGQRFIATVESSGEVVYLRVLTGGKATADSPLLAALRALLPDAQPIGAALSGLAAALRSLGAQAEEGEHRALLKQLTEHIFQPASKGTSLASLIQRSGSGLEAALLAATLKRGRQGEHGSDELRADLKARLLIARAATQEGTLHDALTKALRSIEAEQVLNLARGAGAEAQRISIPFPDPALEGAPWTTAYITLPKRGDEGDASELGSEESGLRFRVEVDLVNLGPIRADLGLSKGRLKLLVEVACERTRSLIHGALPNYIEALSSKGVEVEASVGVVRREELNETESIDEVRYLSEHHLLDESA